jgi:hypothetical protein
MDHENHMLLLSLTGKLVDIARLKNVPLSGGSHERKVRRGIDR